MGWIGDMETVYDCLRAWDAATDEDGKFLLRGGRVVTFLGLDEEAVIDDGVEFLTSDGTWERLIPLLSDGLNVTVI